MPGEWGGVELEPEAPTGDRYRARARREGMVCSLEMSPESDLRLSCTVK